MNGFIFSISPWIWEDPSHSLSITQPVIGNSQHNNKDESQHSRTKTHTNSKSDKQWWLESGLQLTKNKNSQKHTTLFWIFSLSSISATGRVSGFYMEACRSHSSVGPLWKKAWVHTAVSRTNLIEESNHNNLQNISQILLSLSSSNHFEITTLNSVPEYLKQTWFTNK